MIKIVKDDYEYTTYKLERMIGRKIPVGMAKAIYALRWGGVPLTIVTLLLV